MIRGIVCRRLESAHLPPTGPAEEKMEDCEVCGGLFIPIEGQKSWLCHACAAWYERVVTKFLVSAWKKEKEKMV